MKTVADEMAKFYQNLGKLFYAVAATDKTVEVTEFNTLKDLVRQQWLNTNLVTESTHTDAVYQILNVFEWLYKNERLNAEMYFDDFVKYKNDHKHLFTNDIKKLIMQTAHKIAYAFSRVNKSELIMLAKLDMELKK
ncbi:hypothetical protein SAMN05421824_1438 [Hyunsoonleella jejuensis]|uniref:Uncharacterized protein n=1 Tax=Hyunsoonleella jejuensis TaxID=419940 RepID=A0A1H9FC08_9FLAO|nr:hypothetical protein [Hyunsoonleella jejuensis]SEQ35472.1 hypothetical protein SAMN05421824_1438 [Hyunsoonleella jejuensis]